MDEQQPIPLADSSEPVSALPSREELQAELLDVPDELEPPKEDEPSNQIHLEQVLGSVLRHVRGKRGGISWPPSWWDQEPDGP